VEEQEASVEEGREFTLSQRRGNELEKKKRWFGNRGGGEERESEGRSERERIFVY
jgi:hypothetical protein